MNVVTELLDNGCLIKTTLKLFKTWLGLTDWLQYLLLFPRFSLAFYFQEDDGNQSSNCAGVARSSAFAFM